VAVAIRWLDWTERDETHVTRHGVRVSEVNQVLGNPHVLAKNPKGTDNSLFLIGHTDGGRALTIVVSPTNDTSVWRPITAYASTQEHVNLWNSRFNRRKS
jgi:uncharacterized DUF497 family protein